MAKKQSVHPIHMHVPTKIGSTIVGIAVMVYGLFLASSYTSSKEADTIESHAAVISGGGQSGESNCARENKGICINNRYNKCTTHVIHGLCPGGTHIVCCSYKK